MNSNWPNWKPKKPPSWTNPYHHLGFSPLNKFPISNLNSTTHSTLFPRKPPSPCSAWLNWPCMHLMILYQNTSEPSIVVCSSPAASQTSPQTSPGPPLWLRHNSILLSLILLVQTPRYHSDLALIPFHPNLPLLAAVAIPQLCSRPFLGCSNAAPHPSTRSRRMIRPMVLQTPLQTLPAVFLALLLVHQHIIRAHHLLVAASTNSSQSPP